MARTRKTQAGGAAPVWLRKFTQRVGNSAPWGLVKQFTKAYTGDEVKTTTEPQVTYKYIILSLKDGFSIQGRIGDIQIQQEPSTYIAKTYVSKFDDKINTLFSAGKLAFIVNKPNSGKVSQYFILHKIHGTIYETPINDFHELNETIKGINSIRIFLYRHKLIQPSNKVEIPPEFRRNASGLLSHELAGIRNSAPHNLKPENPLPTQYINNRTKQLRIVNKPNNYNQNGNQAIIKARRFMNKIKESLSPSDNLVYLDRHADNSGKFLNPIEFSLALAKLTELPTSSVAIYTMRKSVTMNNQVKPALVFLNKNANDNKKLVFNVLDCELQYLQPGTNKLNPRAISSNLPESVRYIFGISTVSNPKPNTHRVATNPGYADQQNSPNQEPNYLSILASSQPSH